MSEASGLVHRSVTAELRASNFGGGASQATSPPSAVVLFLYQGCVWFCLWFLLAASAKLTFSSETFLWKFLITSLPAVKLGKGGCLAVCSPSWLSKRAIHAVKSIVKAAWKRETFS